MNDKLAVTEYWIPSGAKGGGKGGKGGGSGGSGGVDALFGKALRLRQHTP